MRAQRYGLAAARLILTVRLLTVRLLTVLLLVSISLPLIPVQEAIAAPVAQSDEAIANRVAEIRSGDPDYSHDFESDDGTWGLMYTGLSSIYFKSGTLHVTTDETEELVWSNRDGTFTDFYLEIEAEFFDGPEDSEMGIIFRYIDEDNFYYFGVDRSGSYVIQLLAEGEWYDVTDWEESSIIETGRGAINQLGLLVEGTTISVLINDYVMATTEDDTFDAGGIGLAAVTYTIPGVDIAYDDFKLWDLSGPEVRLPARVPQRPSSETATPEPSPTPIPPSENTEPGADGSDEPTYQETFEQEPEGWAPLEAEGLNYAVDDGQLSIAINRDNALGWMVLPVAPDDYYVEVDTLFRGDVAEAEYGILFRYQDPQNFYIFAVNNNGYYSVWRLVDNSWEALYDWEQTGLLNVGDEAENRLGLLVQEDVFTVSINDNELMTVQDDLFEGGNLALVAGTFGEPNIDVRFDNVTIWSLDAAARTNVRPDATGTPPAPEEPTAAPTQEPVEEPTEEPTPGAGDLPSLTELESRIAQVVDEEVPTVQDDFNRDRQNWTLRTNENSRAFLEDSALQIEINDVDWYQWSSYIDADENLVELGDFYAEVTTFFPAAQPGAATGIAFRLIDVDNYYLYLVTEDGQYALFVQEAGEWRTLIDYTPTDVFATDADALNLIGVLAEGDTLALTLNEQVIDVVQDGTLSRGGLALVGETNDEPGVVVGFDDFFLWELE